MPSNAPPPNPSLGGIILVVRSRSGSRCLFHYPPHPLSTRYFERNKQDDSSVRDDTTSDTDDERTSSTSSDNDNEIMARARSRRHGPTRSYQYAKGKNMNLTDDDDDDGDDEPRNSDPKGGADEKWQPSYEPLLGVGTDGLTGLLAPSDRVWHKRKFEVGFNEVTFLGWPVFLREDGRWEKRMHNHRKRRQQPEPEVETSETTDGEGQDDMTEKHADDPHSQGDQEAKTTTRSEMTMFNVVFILNPPVLEHNLRVKEMYDHVVKKFSRALKWGQARTDYVWTEAELISSIKHSHISKRSLTSLMYKELLSRSSLAAAISTVYTSISTSRIASITLTPTISISLQIPPITSTSVLPSLTDPPTQSGLWLTTANEPPTSELDATIDHSNSSPTSSLHLAKHFGLLLLDTPQQILKDVVTAGGPIAGPLATYISASSPTKSFFKISAASSISLADIQLLARHLVYWRRAMAIPPLHQRDTYIVSPNADMRRLKSGCRAYDYAFPTLPSLPQMLAALSGSPRPYGSLIPSGDHKEVYMQILAFLMRGGWVTQLRTFAFVRVDPAVKHAVKEQAKTEKSARKQNEATRDDRTRGDDNDDTDTTATTTTTSPSLHAKRPSLISQPSNDLKHHHHHHHLHTSQEENPNVATLILNPQRATPLESKYLDHIGQNILNPNHTNTNTKRELSASASASVSDKNNNNNNEAQAHKYWASFVKYFNGTEALEKIPVREGLKRKVVADTLRELGLQFEHGTGGGGVVGGGGGGEGEGGKKRGGDDDDDDDVADGGGGGGASAVLVGIRHW